jgi:hypothetical protein
MVSLRFSHLLQAEKIRQENFGFYSICLVCVWIIAKNRKPESRVREEDSEWKNGKQKMIE